MAASRALVLSRRSIFFAGLGPRSWCSTCATPPKPSDWQLMGGLCLVRMPVVTPEKTDIELKYEKLLRTMEFENSLLSDHELKVLSENKKKESKSKPLVAIDESGQEVVVKLAKDLEAEWEIEFKQFKPNSRTTEDDKTNNLKSIKRAYDRTLYLLVQQMIGGQPVWGLPKMLWKEDTSMRETVEGVLPGLAKSTNMDLFFFGNAPSGYLKYNYPPDAVPQKRGAKVFYYKAQLKSGDQLSLDKTQAKDYAWVTADDLPKYLSPKELAALNRFSPEF